VPGVAANRRAISAFESVMAGSAQSPGQAINSTTKRVSIARMLIE